MRDYRIPKPICLTLFIVLKVQTFCTFINFVAHQAFFLLCVPLKISLEVPQDKAKNGGRAREGKYSEWPPIFYHSLKQSY